MNFTVLPIFDQAPNYCRIGERQSLCQRASWADRRKLDDSIGPIFLSVHATSSQLPLVSCGGFGDIAPNATID